MKCLLFVFYLILFTQEGYAQELIYKTVYQNNNLDLALCSDNRYELTSSWSSEEGGLGMIYCWTEGHFRHISDTLLMCIDLKNNKKFYLSKKDDDIIRIISWDDYKNRDSEISYDLLGRNEPNDKVCLDDLLMEDNLLKIRSIYEGDILIKVFSWKTGKKELFYEKGVGVIKQSVPDPPK